MREIVSSMSLFLPFLDLFAALCGNGMLESMLEPHLTKSGASAIDVGISFLAFGCCYMLGNLLFGGVIQNISWIFFFMAKLFLKVICCATWKTTDVYCLYGNFYSSSPLLHSPEEFLFFLYFISCSSLTSLVTLWFSPCLETFCSCSHSYSLVLFHLCSWSHTNHLFR